MAKIEDEILQGFLRRLSESDKVPAETMKGLTGMVNEPDRLRIGTVMALIEHTTGEALA